MEEALDGFTVLLVDDHPLFRDGLAGVQLGPGPVADNGGLGQALPDIEAGHPGGGVHDALAKAGDMVAKLAEKIVFQGLARFTRGQDLFFQGF